MEIRTGIGEDSHQFCNNKKLILGGCEIDYANGLKANSDGDVIIHALCNTYDVVVGKGSISNYADSLLKDGTIKSAKYLEYINEEAKRKGWKIKSISISIEAGKPNLEDKLPEIKKSLSEIMLLRPDQIGITVTSGENMSDYAKGKGIKTIAITLFEKD